MVNPTPQSDPMELTPGPGDDNLEIDPLDEFYVRNRECPTPPESRCPSPSTIPTEATYKPRPEVALDVLDACSNLFLNHTYSDFTIVVGSHRFPAHKSIVCTQSAFFECCLRGSFQEAQTSTVTITDESPKDIIRLLHYLYNKTYLDTAPDTTDNPSDDSGAFHHSTRINFAMYRLADKFVVPGLARLAAENHLCRLDDVNLVTELVWAARRAYAQFEGRWDAMRMLHVYVIGECVARWKRSEMAKEKGLRRLCEEHGDFAWDLLDMIKYGEEWKDSKMRRVLDWKMEGGKLTIRLGKKPIQPEADDYMVGSDGTLQSIMT